MSPAMSDVSNTSPPPRGEYISANNVEDAKARALIWKAVQAKATSPIILKELEETLSSTIKADRINKLLSFLTMLLNYTSEDQQNVSFNAPSSAGKSFNALEVSKYFPAEDVDILSYTSPTAFFHEKGKLVGPDNEPLADLREYVTEKMEAWEKSTPRLYAEKRGDPAVMAWREKRKAEYQRARAEWDGIEKKYIVDLERRIIIFVDQPHDRLLQVLRSLLSHDRKEINTKITDKTKEGGNRTKSVTVRGYPTVFFASAAFSMDPQEQTRFWLLSPEMSQDKIAASLDQQSKALSDRRGFNEGLEADEKRLTLKARVEAIKRSGVSEILLRPEDAAAVLSWFKTRNPLLAVRDQRDFPRVIAITKAHALLNCFSRERTADGGGIYVTREDVEAAEELLDGVLESNRMGLPPYLHGFWVDSVKPELEAAGSMSRERLSILYGNQFNERLGEKARKRVIELMADAGLIAEKPDPDDKRRMLIVDAIAENIYSPRGGGEKNDSDLCIDCKQPVTDGSEIWFKDGRVCGACAEKRKAKRKEVSAGVSVATSLKEAVP